MKPSIAYVAAGKLHLVLGDAPPRAITSSYAEKVRERAQSIDRRHAWKTEGRGGRFAGAGAWAGADELALVAPVARITGLARARSEGQILYALDTEMVAGVFSYEIEGGAEKRIYHATDKRLVDLATHPDHEAVACAIRHKNGTSSIALMREDGAEIQIVTDGDTIDLAPRWIADSPRSLVYQSAGVGRDPSGVFAGVGPFSVVRLDVEDGKLSTLIEDNRFDFVHPQLASGGSLFAIRRPYAGADKSVPVGRVISDTLLAPFRVGNAVVQYLNFFTARYTGKPLVTSKGARSRAADAKRMAELGNLAEANEAARRALEREEQDNGNVPSTWELVRFTSGGSVEIVATGVASYDLVEGGVVFSDGRHISVKRGDDKPERIASDQDIERVVAL
jgi:hypothetical protein